MDPQLCGTGSGDTRSRRQSRLWKDAGVDPLTCVSSLVWNFDVSLLALTRQLHKMTFRRFPKSSSRHLGLTLDGIPPVPAERTPEEIGRLIRILYAGDGPHIRA